MNIVFCSSEVVPFTKTGGLADVTGSLPLALEKLGHEVIIIKPYYASVKFTDIYSQGHTDVAMTKISKNVKVYFIGNDHFFKRKGIYGDEYGDYPDNLERFAFYCHEALNLLKRLGNPVDVIHCHDWHTGLIPVLLKSKFKRDPFFKNVRTVFTIHNLAYQGVFPKDQYAKLGVDREFFHVHGFEFHDQINIMKAGIIFADTVTTVSPQYAKEIQGKEYGCGLDGVLRAAREGVVGILNGLDYDLWNPETDTLIDTNYSDQEWEKKYPNKAALQRLSNLEENPEIPLLGFVGRLCHQKGVDLLMTAIDDLVAMNVQVVFVGTGGKRYHRLLEECAQRYPKNVATHLVFEEKIAHWVYAGSDLFLMPSIFEPCGLGQMIALHYGAIPIVFKTGGLADTIKPYNAVQRSGNGFVFTEYTKDAILFELRNALAAYHDRPNFQDLMQRAMRSRFSWDKSALEYEKVYQRCLSLV